MVALRRINIHAIILATYIFDRKLRLIFKMENL